MIRVLHIFHCMGNGGIEHFVMNIYRKLDRSKVQFDFLISSEETGFFDQEIHELGGKVFYASPLKKNLIKNYMDIVRIVKENNYQIIHRHTGSAFGYFDLRAARRGGAKNLILHSHNPQVGKKALHYMCRFFLSFDCIRFACSQEAGEFLFGRKKPFTVIKNAIDTPCYVFDLETRQKVRENLQLDDKFVIGHVGRFNWQKNHKRLLEIFKVFLEKRENSVLVCVGDGDLLEAEKLYAKELKIDHSVRFLGNRSDVSQLMNAFDEFCLPSNFEGFSITLVEAQTNGLNCVVSQEGITSTSNITGNVHYLSLDQDNTDWADALIQYGNRDAKAVQRVKQSGYDISDMAKQLENYYIGLLK